MGVQTYANLLNSPGAPAAGLALSNTVTATNVEPAPSYNLPSPPYLYPGQQFRLTSWGVFSTTTTTPGTLTLGFYYGGATATALVTTGAITPATSAANWPWRMEATGTIRSLGTAGTILTMGWWGNPTSVSAWTNSPMPNAAVAAVTIDTTTAKSLTVGATWGTANASNSLTCHGFIIEQLN